MTYMILLSAIDANLNGFVVLMVRIFIADRSLSEVS